MRAKRTWPGLALAVLAALAVGVLVAPPGGADEHKLKEVKDGEVSNEGEQAKDIDYDDEEPVSPESVTPVGETVTIVSKTMTPPDDMEFFKEFPSPNPWHFVDIETDPDAPPGSADTDTASAIKILVEDVPETAGDWPLKGEGNLKPPAGGGGPKEWHWSAKMYKYRLVIKNPCDANGDGKINDDANADNNYTGNEFTYTWDTPGVLTIPVRVEITPDTPEVRAEVQDKVRIRIDAINDSHGAQQNVEMEWDNPWPGEATAGKGVYNAETKTWNATATFTKLPPLNDDFGKKTVTAEIVDGVSDEVEIEVFWPLLNQITDRRDNDTFATNNPEHGGPLHFRPNWFVYWLQTVALVGDPLPTVVYDESSQYYAGQAKIGIGSDCSESIDKEYVTSNPLQGIDLFAWALIHECQHHVDWCAWWGVNYTLGEYNENNLGKTGAANDLDGDRVPNGVEDANSNGQYDEGEQYDWQTKNTVPSPPRDEKIDNDWDERICRQHNDARGDHAKDWGNPGMNHGTEGKYDD